MRTLRSPATGACALVLAAVTVSAAAPAAADSGTVEAAAPRSVANVRAYWTPARMAAAQPAGLLAGGASTGAPAAGTGAVAGEPSFVAPTAPGGGAMPSLSAGRLGGAQATDHEAVNRTEVADPSAEPVRAHGKVFLTIPSGLEAGDYVCSATAISSNNRSVVWTAAHCVYEDSGGGFVTNWAFVPAYDSGAEPFGEWPAEELATTQEYKQSENVKYDVGAAIVKANGSGQTLGEVVGGRGIGFSQPRTQTYHAFGYPALPPFTGETEYECTSGFGGTDNPGGGSGPLTQYIACDMNGGASGGGWVADGSVLSVTSYKYCDDPAGLVCEDDIYGPYQDTVAEDLYQSVTGKAESCGGKAVTIGGTTGDDAIKGTAGPDVIKAKGGDDTIKAKDGNDRVCAGTGADLLKGKDGKDALSGGGGADDLKGGESEKDSCDGGSGHDRASSCERVTDIP